MLLYSDTMYVHLFKAKLLMARLKAEMKLWLSFLFAC